MSYTLFTDFEPDRNVKIAISSIVGNISSQIYSHRGAWAAITKDQLLEAGYPNVTILYKHSDPSWEKYDVVLIDNSVETKGKLSFFQGPNSLALSQINRLYSSRPRMYSLMFDMPDVASEVLAATRTNVGAFQPILDNIDRLSQICSKIPRIDFIDKCKHQILGDTHSSTVYAPKSNIVAKTQWSLRDLLNSGIATNILPWAESLTICIGHTDIRHLLMRDQDPIRSIDLMIDRLESQLLSTKLTDISIRQVLPVERDGRRIQLTSYYKKLPYFGTWQERLALSKYMNIKIEEICNKNWWQCIKNPIEIFDNDGSLSWECMEQSMYSEYLSREYYLWDFENRIKNTFK